MSPVHPFCLLGSISNIHTDKGAEGEFAHWTCLLGAEEGTGGGDYLQGFWGRSSVTGDSDQLILMSTYGNTCSPSYLKKTLVQTNRTFLQFSLLSLSGSLQLRKQQLSGLFWLFVLFFLKKLQHFFIVCTSFFCTLKELPLDLSSSNLKMKE